MTAAALVGGCATTGQAWAGPLSLTRTALEEPRFPAGCFRSEPPAAGSVGEPHAAADPRDPQKVVVGWMQGVSPAGGAMADVIGVSRDGGRRWRTVVPQGVNGCTGDPDWDRNGDPWLTFGPTGTAYLVHHLGSPSSDPDSAVPGGGRRSDRVSASPDGGLTWLAPTLVAENPRGTGTVLRNDRPSIAAHPRRGGTIYFATTKYGPATFSSWSLWFAKTTDGNRTWSPERLVYPGVFGWYPHAAQIFVLPNDDLVMLFQVLTGPALTSAVVPSFPAGETHMMAMRSSDDGDTWSGPVRIATAVDRALFDEDANVGVFPALPNVSAAVAPDGSLHATWHDNAPDRESGRIRHSRSVDGIRWSPPTDVAVVPSQAMTPTLAVDRRGTVGIHWYDFRDDRRGDDEFTTSVHLAHSHDAGATWSEMKIGGPFDLRRSLRRTQFVLPGWFIGDYYGMAGLRDGFVSVLIETKPGDADDPTDVIVARTVPAEAPGDGAPSAIRLAVRPPKARAGRRTRFRFHATTLRSGRRVPVGRALVRFAGRRARTDGRGRASMTVGFHRAGGRRAVVSKPGFRSDSVRVRVMRAAPQRRFAPCGAAAATRAAC